jgi:hypothetical protein
MSNRIGSIEDKQLVSIINDSDRYKDISLLFYEQNRDLYIKYFKYNSKANLESTPLQARHKIDIEMNQNYNTQTKICSIL